MTQSPSKLVARAGVLVALAAVFSYIEAIIPIPLGVPGIKLGLANVVVLFAMYNMSFGTAVLVSLIRIVLVSSMFGNPVMALYSIAGASVSLLVMAALKKSGLFSIIGVSMAGGVFHNAAQLTVAVAVTGSIALIAYLPILIAAGMITGVFIGIITHVSTRHTSAISRRE